MLVGRGLCQIGERHTGLPHVGVNSQRGRYGHAEEQVAARWVGKKGNLPEAKLSLNWKLSSDEKFDKRRFVLWIFVGGPFNVATWTNGLFDVYDRLFKWRVITQTSIERKSLQVEHSRKRSLRRCCWEQQFEDSWLLSLVGLVGAMTFMRLIWRPKGEWSIKYSQD